MDLYDLGRSQLIDLVNIPPNKQSCVPSAFPAFTGRKIIAKSNAKLACNELNK